MSRLAAAVLVYVSLMATAAWSAPLSFSYGGRLTQGDQSVEGPVDLELRFYRSGNKIATAAFNTVKLVDGVFQVEVTPAQVGNSLDGGDDVFVEVFDKTSNISYPRQRLVSMPFAIYANKVPVDEATLSFGSDGKLKVVNPYTGSAIKLQGQTVSSVAPTTAGQVLKWNGSAWEPGSDEGPITTESSPISGYGNFVVKASSTATTDLRFNARDNVNYIGFKAPDTIATSKIWTLPAADGSNLQVLTTDGSGNLSWRTPSGGGDMSKITYDSNANNKVDSAETADNATQFGGQAAAYYTNASNLNAGTVAYARLPVGTAASALAPSPRI